MEGNGAHNIKNLTKITSELQDIIQSSQSADIEQMRLEEDFEANHMGTLEELNHFDFKGLKEEESIKYIKLNEPVPSLTTSASKLANSHANKVSLIYFEFVTIIQSISVAFRAARDRSSSLNKFTSSLNNFIFSWSHFPFLVF